MAYNMKRQTLALNTRMRTPTTEVGAEPAPETPIDDTAEDQQKPELQQVKDFVNGLDDVQFGYLQECIQKRLEAGMDEVDAADAKPAEVVFEDMAEENEESPRTRNE